MNVRITLPLFVALLALMIAETVMYFSFGIGDFPLQKQAAQYTQYKARLTDAERYRDAILAQADQQRREENRKMAKAKADRNAVWDEIERQAKSTKPR